MKTKIAWGMSGLMSLVIASAFYYLGYNYGLHAAQETMLEWGLTPQGMAKDAAQSSLIRAVGSARLINLLDKDQTGEAAKQILSGMVISLDSVHLQSVGASELAHSKTALLLDPGGLNKAKWHKDLNEIRECAMRKNISKTVQQVDEILKWLDNPQSPNQ